MNKPRFISGLSFQRLRRLALRPLPVALCTLLLALSGFALVRGRAASGSFHWPAGLTSGTFAIGRLTGDDLAIGGTVTCPTSFTVNDTGDGIDASAGDGICATSGGVCTLRAAIREANAQPCAGTITIGFNIAGTGIHTITPASLLPEITRPVILDGTTQSGASCTTVGGLKIELNGTSAGTTPGQGGLVLSSTANGSVIKGLVVNRFGFYGIFLNSSSNDTVQCSYIGTDVAGTTALGYGNAHEGIRVKGNNNLIGGTTAGAGNVVSGNYQGIRSEGTSNTIQGNYVGLSANGTEELGNSDAGIFLLSSRSNTVGGPTAAARNVIAGNNAGIRIESSSNSIVKGNYIGTDASGTNPLGNSYGLKLGDDASNNTIGGTGAGEGNVITASTNEGIFVDTQGTNTGNTFRGNRIYANGTRGIDLGNTGVTANDAKDVDTGANNLQNFPILTGAPVAGTTVGGRLNSTPGQTFTIDVYSNTACDPSGNGEGQTYLGSVTTGATDGNGDVSFSVTVPTLSGGQVLTATATDASGNTSEFSQCFTAGALETEVTLSGGSLTITDANGGTTDDTLTLKLVSGNLRIHDPNNTPNAVLIPLSSITGNITINTLGGNDTLTLDLSGGNFLGAGLTFNGGENSDDHDQLKITGYSLMTADGIADVTVNHTGPEAGNVVLNGLGTVRFTEIEPLSLGGPVADLVINLPAGPNTTTILADDGSGPDPDGNTANSSAIFGATFEYTQFINPTNSLTINRGSASDNLTVVDLVFSEFNASLSIGSGANPFSTITFAGLVTLATDKNLSGDASGTISLSSASADLATSGTGMITLTTARNITLASGSSIAVVNGTLTLTANTAGATTGNFIGIDVNNGLIQASGTGAVTVQGSGGNDSAGSQGGVRIGGGGDIIGGTSGLLTVQGTGGASTGGINFGVQIINAGSTINSNGSNVSVTGIEGGSTSVAIDGTGGSAITTATNGGTLTLIGNSMNFDATTTISAQNTSSVTLQQRTNGVAIDLGAATDPSGGPLSLTDAELDLITAGTLNIGDSNSGAITVSADITRAAGTNMELASGGDVIISGGQVNTGGGTLLLHPGSSPAAVKPTKSSTDVKASTLSFASDLAIVIDGTTLDTEYNQLNVVGQVDLTGVDLVIGGSYSPAPADTFTIVNNDGNGDPIIGTFNGLPEGAPVTVNGSSFVISYVGGDGNDVVLSFACQVPFTVDDSGDGGDETPGDGICDEGSGDCTLRAAIEEANALPSCGTIDINFAIGSAEIELTNGELLVDHSVNINGPNDEKVRVSSDGSFRVFHIQSGNVTISHLSIAGGGETQGGGIYNEGGTLGLTACSIYANQAFVGAGIFNAAGRVATITNSTISNNLGLPGSGGIFNDGTLEITNSTIAENVGGFLVGGASGIENTGTLTIRNSIVSGGSNGPNGPNCAGTITSLGHNISSDNQCTSFTQTGDLQSTDPMLGLLGDNGGPTWTHALLVGSPAINGGDNCVLTLNGCVTNPAIATDQRGVARPQPVGGTVDIGAFELQKFIVNTTDDHDDDRCNAADCSLREAINAANANPGSAIVFGIPTSGPTPDPNCDVNGVCTITVSDSLGNLPQIIKSVQINGYTQAGATPNTKPFNEGDDASLKIVLDGHLISSGGIGLDLEPDAGGSVIKGLVINHFSKADIYLNDLGDDLISGNFLGTDVTGTQGDGTDGDGIVISGFGFDLIGGDLPADRNLISGRTNGSGIAIFASDNTVEGNYIGTTLNGLAGLGNKFGVSIHEGAADNTIGCEVLDGSNLISGNSDSGVFIDTADGNAVVGNFIGTDNLGTGPIANGIGVNLLDSSDTLISFIGTGAGNVISGNTNDGILIKSSSPGTIGGANIIQGNRIGTDTTGMVKLANGGAGVELDGSSDNEIGCTTPEEGNVIAGNGGDGVEVTGGASNNLIQGNFIGVGLDGTTAIGNLGSGIEIYTPISVGKGSSVNTIGPEASGGGGDNLRTAFADRAVKAVSPVSQTGVKSASSTVEKVGASAKQRAARGRTRPTTKAVRSNLQAVRDRRANIASKTPSRTRSKGLLSKKRLGGYRFAVGPSGPSSPTLVDGANIIAYNGVDGVRISNAADVGNLISQNSIYANAGLGINLGTDGVTPNDLAANLDADTGANNLQNFPEIASATESGGMVTITGTLDSLANSGFRIEFFANSVCDGNTGGVSSGTNGEGQTFLGFKDVNTDAAGHVDFTSDPLPLTGGSIITATATLTRIGGASGTIGDTSEFSACRALVPKISINDVSKAEGNAGTTSFDFTVSLSNPSSQTITVDYATANDTAAAPVDFTAITTTQLQFDPGQTSKTVTVLVNGDTTFEAAEQFFVNLSNVNANATILDNQGVGTITNDDGQPKISISDVTREEGNAGTTSFDFTVSLSNASSQTITVDYATANDTAAAPADFTALPTTQLQFDPGQTSKTVTVLVNGDTTFEANEQFFVNLSNVNANATILDNQGVATITNDDNCPTTFTVDNNGDADDATPGDGVCATAGAACTLRAAIQEANAASVACGTISINFSTGTATITPASPLTINHSVNINGPANASVTVNGNNATRIFDVTTNGAVGISNLNITGGNVNGGNGAGVLNSSSGTITITGSTFANNRATNGNGGAIASSGGTINLINSTFSGNVATSGGAIYQNIGGTLNLTNCTVAGNNADATIGQGGGIFLAGGTLNLRNAIVSQNTASTGADLQGIATLNDHNFIGGNALLGLLQDNGGPTQTQALLYNSPALEAGNDCVAQATHCGDVNIPQLNSDQRGFPRQTDGDNNGTATVDIGAYERLFVEIRDVASGSQVQVDLSDARLTFPTVSDLGNGARGMAPAAVGGTVSLNVIDPNAQGTPPAGYSIGNTFNPPLPAFDVTPSSNFYTPPVSICFYLPSITDATFFAGLRVLHKEGGVLVDPGSQVNFANKLVCTKVTSFSAFVIAHTAAPTAANGSISGRITDSNGAPVAGTVINLSGTQTAKTITDSNGNYHFDDVQANGFYAVTPARANYIFSPATRSFSQQGNHTEAVFTGVSTGEAANPLDTPEYFVRQHYLDFLGREPDRAGFNYWSDGIIQCNGDPGCIRARRIDVSAAFFIEREFQLSGSFIYRLYKGALGRQLSYGEFATDRMRVIGGPNLDASKAAFVDEFVQRAEFADKFQSNTTAEGFVDALLQAVGATGADVSSERANLIDRYRAGTNMIESRSLVVRQLADNPAFSSAVYNQSFVLMQYFGYLGRNPDAVGYDFWLNVLNGSVGGDPGNYRGMVCWFITSTEYQRRFSQVVTHDNAECSGVR